MALFSCRNLIDGLAAKVVFGGEPEGIDEPVTDTDDSDTESDGLASDLNIEFESESDQIMSGIQNIVDCLLRLSMSIRNPAPHDRFMAAKSTDTSSYEPFDI